GRSRTASGPARTRNSRRSASIAAPAASRSSPGRCSRNFPHEDTSLPWRRHERGAMKVLHVAAEVFPLVKTGGLGDVVAALPPMLAERGLDARLILPGLPAIRDGVRAQKKIAEFGPAFGAASVVIRHGRMPETGVQAYVVDAPWL